MYMEYDGKWYDVNLRTFERTEIHFKGVCGKQ